MNISMKKIFYLVTLKLGYVCLYTIWTLEKAAGFDDKWWSVEVLSETPFSENV